MDRDATFLLALIMLAAAALVVGVSGWVLFVRDHRAWKSAHAPDPDTDHQQVVEDV
jgi:hypothetical protein